MKSRWTRAHRPSYRDPCLSQPFAAGSAVDNGDQPGQRKTHQKIDPRNDEAFYVGKGVNGRMKVHLQGRGSHGNRKLQNKILKILSLGLKPIGEKIFEHEDEWPCHANEMAAIAFYGMSNLCNLTNGGEGTSGRMLSNELRARLSASQSGAKGFWFGKKQSPEVIAKRVAATTGSKNGNFGKAMPQEVRDKISEKLKGKPLSPETVAKMIVVATGKPKSLKHRANISAARKGRKCPELAGSNNGMFGKKHSPEIRKKISEQIQTRIAAGKIHGRAKKLTSSQEDDIIRLLDGGKLSTVKISHLFSVSRKLIWRLSKTR